jgi:hypothetical protein
MATFEAFALQCAAGMAIELLAGIAAVESGGRPLSVRDGDKVIDVASASEGIAVVVGLIDRGRDPGIGLTGVTSTRLAAAGASIGDGFDPCTSMRAASQAFFEASNGSLGRGLGAAAAERAAVRSWWRPDSRFQAARMFEAAVRVAPIQDLIRREFGRSPVPTPAAAAPKSDPRAAVVVVAPRSAEFRREVVEPPCWDVFARARFGSQCEAAGAAATGFK